MKSRKIATALVALALMVGASSATNAGSNACSACYTKYLQCLRSGVGVTQCYANYEDCLALNRCPIPVSKAVDPKRF